MQSRYQFSVIWHLSIGAMFVLFSGCATHVPANPPTSPYINSKSPAPPELALQAIDWIAKFYVDDVDLYQLANECLLAVGESPKLSAIGDSLDFRLQNIARQFNDSLSSKPTASIHELCIPAMVAKLDKHSDYLGPSDYEYMVAEGSSNGATGLEFRREADRLIITSVEKGSSAELVGVRRGDELVSVDGIAVGPLKPQKVFSALNGPKGSIVSVGLRRSGQSMPITVPMIRETVKHFRPATFVRRVDGKILYVAATTLSETSLAELAAKIALERGKSDASFRGIVLDLRWSPGGALNSGVELAAFFLKRETLVARTTGRNSDTNLALRASKSHYLRAGKGVDPVPLLPPELFSAPMAVIVGPDTAAGAELVAGALSDNNRAVLVGGKTAGIGSVQTIFPVATDFALKLTTAKMYLPNGSEIDNLGIKPRIEVDVTEPDHLPAGSLTQSRFEFDDQALLAAIGALQLK